MTNLLVSILALAITSGQLIKVPVGLGGISVLDIFIFLFCLWGLYKINLHLKKPPIWLLAALFFVLISIISLLLTPLHLEANEYLMSFSYTIRFFFYLLFAWLIFCNAFKDLQNKIEKVFLLSGTAFAVLGLLQFVFFPNLSFLANSGWDPHYFRTVSTFLDPNFAGAFFVLTLLLITFLKNKRIMSPKVFYLFFSLVYVALLTTYSRSSYGMFLISFSAWSFLVKSWRLFIASLLLFVILLLGFFTYTKGVSEPRNIDRIQSASFRLNTWQQGLKLFSSYPVLGVGFNAYRFALRDYNLGDKQFLSSHGSSSNDSSILFVAATTGIVGLIVYLYFLFLLIKQRNIVSAATLGLLFHSIFANSLFFSPILLWLLLISLIPKK